MFNGKWLLDYAYVISSNKYGRKIIYFRLRKIDEINYFIEKMKQKD